MIVAQAYALYNHHIRQVGVTTLLFSVAIQQNSGLRKKDRIIKIQALKHGMRIKLIKKSFQVTEFKLSLRRFSTPYDPPRVSLLCGGSTKKADSFEAY